MKELKKGELILRLNRANNLLYNVLQIMKAQDDLKHIESIFDLEYNINYNDELITCDGSSLQVDIANHLDEQGINLAEVITDDIRVWAELGEIK